MKIRADETAIRGSWAQSGKDVLADDACRRIDELVQTYLEKIGHDASGWDALYRDPADGRYWELVYPESDLHGGGPPTLLNTSPDHARSKYGRAGG